MKVTIKVRFAHTQENNLLTLWWLTVPRDSSRPHMSRQSQFGLRRRLYGLFHTCFFNISVLMKPEHLRPKEMEMNRPELPAFLIPTSTKPRAQLFCIWLLYVYSALLTSRSDFTTFAGRLNSERGERGYFYTCESTSIIRLHLITILYKLNLRNTILWRFMPVRFILS